MTQEKIILGHLIAYWEQGWEGRIEYGLSQTSDDDTVTGKWPYFLQNGQHLRIFQIDGSILWEGEINLVKRRWYEKHRLPNGIWHTKKQKGLPYHQWISWFWHKPPLRAELTTKGNYSSADQSRSGDK